MTSTVQFFFVKKCIVVCFNEVLLEAHWAWRQCRNMCQLSGKINKQIVELRVCWCYQSCNYHNARYKQYTISYILQLFNSTLIMKKT
jgi:hypothetical protein